MSKHTIVLRFEDCEEPAYHAGMEVLGGSVEAVQFSDALDELQAIEEQRDELLEALEAMIEESDPMKLNCGEPWCRARAAITKARGE